MKVRAEQVSLVGWQNLHSSSQEPSSLLLFAHPLTMLHLVHTLGMLLHYSILDAVSLVEVKKRHKSSEFQMIFGGGRGHCSLYLLVLLCACRTSTSHQ